MIKTGCGFRSLALKMREIMGRLEIDNGLREISLKDVKDGSF